MNSNLSFLCFVLFVCFLASFAFAAALSLFRATDSNIFIYNTFFHSRRLVPSFTPFSHSISQLLHFTSSSCSLFTVDIIFDSKAPHRASFFSSLRLMFIVLTLSSFLSSFSSFLFLLPPLYLFCILPLPLCFSHTSLNDPFVL